MYRIFSSLAILTTLLLMLVIYLGIETGPYNERFRQFQSERQAWRSQLAPEVDAGHEPPESLTQQYQHLLQHQRAARVHILAGVAAGLVCVFVHSLSVTYFIGTSRWCKEVVQTYSLPEELMERSVRLKRHAFPWSILGILTVIAILGLGAAADPGTLRQTTGQYVTPHWVVAIGGSLLIVIAYTQQAIQIYGNTQLVDEISAHVQKVRRQKGLDMEQEYRHNSGGRSSC